MIPYLPTMDDLRRVAELLHATGMPQLLILILGLWLGTIWCALATLPATPEPLRRRLWIAFTWAPLRLYQLVLVRILRRGTRQ
jgi:hypothetical protein